MAGKSRLTHILEVSAEHIHLWLFSFSLETQIYKHKKHTRAVLAEMVWSTHMDVL